MFAVFKKETEKREYKKVGKEFCRNNDKRLYNVKT
jgi:hypothetical protein